MKKLVIPCIFLALAQTAHASDSTPCYEYDIALPSGLLFASNDQCFENSGLIAVKDSKDKYGYVNTKGELVVAPTFDRAWDFAEGLAVVKKGEKHGYIKPNGDYAIQPTYDDAWDFQGGLAAVQMGEKYGYIDKAGKAVIPVEYDDTYSYLDKNFALVKKQERWGMIDRKGKIIAPIKYDELDGIGDGRIVAKLGNHFGYLDYQGKVAIAFAYEHASPFTNGVAEVLKKGDTNYTNINRQGKPVALKADF